MASDLVKNEIDEKQLIQEARKRVELPAGWLRLRYSREADVLVVRFSENKSVRSKGDIENGIVYDYDARGNLVSVEIIDLFGTYTGV